MPYIKPDFIEKIEASIDIVAVIGAFIKLKKSGSVYKGLSPWTSESTPSLMVSPVKQIFKDFSSGKGGGAIHFVMEHKGWNYPETIEYLANTMNLPVEYDESVDVQALTERKEKRVELSSLVQRTINYYHKAFMDLPEDHPAKIEIYGKRGYTPEIAERWEIGYAEGNKTLYNLLKERGMAIPGEECGVVKNGNDRFWNRVIYPLYDGQNKAIGIAGRDISGSEKAAKWINPADTELYDKSSVLYGLNEARDYIHKANNANLVEGYNDVIAWHEHGVKNTVSSSGTAITHQQLKLLRKICRGLTLCMDGDNAGTRAMIKAIPLCLQFGFTVRVLQLPGCDPDEFVRLYKDSIATAKKGLPGMLAEEDTDSDGFGVLMKHSLVGNEIEIARATRKLCEVVAQIDDDAMSKIYIGWLSKETKLTKTDIGKWVKEAKEEMAEEPEKDLFFATKQKYVLPDEVTTPLDKLAPTIDRYRLFMSNNRIYVVANDVEPFFFKSVSNFTISVVQHMEDDKFPSKLLHVRNVSSEEKIFDIPSGDINTPQTFDKTMTDRGNYFFKGNRQDLQLIREYLYDQMGNGRRIDVLGWQPEGFWCWNNKVRLEDGTPVNIDDNGLVKVDGVSYYVPSANKIYANNPFRYDAQKKFSVFQCPVSFEKYSELLLTVHGDHAITALLWTMANFFQDIIIKETKGYPILFLYGPASSGKDMLMECAQSFFGKPQTAINLEGGVSTVKAQIREFAQFYNSVGHLSEYKRGDKSIDGIVKGLWDRRGYKRGNIESHVGTESIPVISATGLTGNDYPDAEAVISRLLGEDMIRTTFTEEEIAKYEELSDILAKGISSLGDDVLAHRLYYQKNFQKQYRIFKQGFGEKVPEAKSRLISNCSVLGATYHILKDRFQFPFDHARMTAHLVKITEAQMRRMASASILTKWWDCFLASMRGNIMDTLRLNKDFKIEYGTLHFNFTNVYNKIGRQWQQQYRELAPAKGQLMTELRKDSCYVMEKTSDRIGDTNTSSMLVNLEHVDLHQEIHNAMIWQMNEKTLFDESPATPNEKTKDDDHVDLPF